MQIHSDSRWRLWKSRNKRSQHSWSSSALINTTLLGILIYFLARKQIGKQRGACLAQIHKNAWKCDQLPVSPLAGNGPKTFMLPTQSKQESFLPAGQCWGIGSRWCPFLLVHPVFLLHPSPQYKETLAGQEEPAYLMAADSPVQQRDYTLHTRNCYSKWAQWLESLFDAQISWQ